MSTISLCMIVKNEGEVLYQCLNSVKEICDEIIIVDTGSTDNTREIAKQFTEKVIDFRWIDDFSAARNFAFSQATMDYILWLDADDVLMDEDQKKLLHLKNNLNHSIDSVAMLYHLAFDEDGKPTLSYRRNRLVKREKHFKWIGSVHEYLEVWGNIIHSDIAITHQKKDKTNTSVLSDRNLKIYESLLNEGEVFTPRDLFYYANELKDHQQLEKSLKFYQRFLETKQGWVEDEIRACVYMADCYRQLGDIEKELDSLVLSLKYDVPRPEASCRLGDIFLRKGEIQKAIKWYRIALEVEDDNQWFIQDTYSTLYPNLQLCVCYWKKGDVHQSYKHHKKTLIDHPNDPRVKQNEEFFKEYLRGTDL